MRFTKPSIEALKKRADRYEVWEDGKSGLGIRVSPSGRKTWVLMYRHEGRPRRMTLGTYPKISIASAHTKAGSAHEALEHGRDPGAENVAHRRAERAAETVGELIDEYLARHAANKKSGAEDKRNLNREIRPAWGKRKAKSINRRDVIVLLDKIEDRGTPVMRNRTAALLSKMFMFGVHQGIVDASPCVAIRRLPETARDRVLAPAEIKTLWKGLDNADMAPVVRLALRFLLATGQRRAEVAGARRDEIAGDVWTIPPERQKKHRTDRPAMPHVVPLSPLSKAILADIDALRAKEAKRHERDQLSPWLFPSPLEGTMKKKGGTHGHITPSSLSHALANNLADLGLEPPGGRDAPPAPTPHDFRRTCATTMAELGVSPHVVGRVLNHAEAGTTARHYDKFDYVGPKRAALDAWGHWVEAVVAGSKIRTNVTALRPTA